jgi:malate:Na+ symporter
MSASRRLETWWNIVDWRIGIVPAPAFILLLAVIAAFVATGNAPSDILFNIAVLSVGGFACAEVGKRIPLLGQMGAGAIFATFIPSYLVYAHLLPATLPRVIGTKILRKPAISTRRSMPRIEPTMMAEMNR